VSRRSLLVLIAVAAAVLAGVLFWHSYEAPPPATAPGVPLALATDRAARITNLHYILSLSVPLVKTEPIHGHLSATFTLRQATRPLPFDFAQADDHLSAVSVNQRTLDPHIVNGHITIPQGMLASGANTVEFDFTAGDQSLNRSDDFLYTLFVPARASLAMPCFDQPSLKATWRLSLDIPSEWAAVANGAERQRQSANGRTTIDFAETQPLPTYLFAFAAGKFQIETAVHNGRVFRMFHRENDAAKVARNRDAIFDLHARALTWLEQYTGIPYPFGKFDFVLIPSFQFGGMEHAGAIFYNAASLMLDESATQNQLLGRANVISHETSHMWFGDLVTMRWFNDVWMKEVFANFMAAKIVDPSFPDVNHDLRFLMQNYPVAYDVDRTDGANPIRQNLENLDDAGSLYGAIIYQKAPIVMRQLELLMGAEAFRDGLRDYLRDHEFGNATWPDLVNTLAGHTPVDVAAWSHAWIDEPGRPLVRTELDLKDGRIRRLAFRQEDPRGRKLLWPQKIRVLVASPQSSHTFDVTLSQLDTEVPDAAGLDAPLFVLPVSAGLGYGLFDFDPASLTFLTDVTNAAFLKRALPSLDPLARGSAIVAIWEEMLEGRVPPARVRDLLLTLLPGEDVELNLQQMLGQLRTMLWRFTPADARLSMAARVEDELRAGLAHAKTTSVKSAWFGAFRSLALTPASLAWLERVWRHEESIPGLSLAEPDDAEIAMELAVRDVPHAGEILKTQLARLTNADRKARFAFVMPALSSDAAIRQRFFESLADVKNRRHEAWVLEALTYLNHPLRAQASQRFITPALALVLEIQRTGDIFFPKRWTDAVLGAYQSREAATAVRNFLDTLPAGYPPRLKWVIEASADPLFRAARLVSPRS
jgi:aminopeptidase N